MRALFGITVSALLAFMAVRIYKRKSNATKLQKFEARRKLIEASLWHDIDREQRKNKELSKIEKLWRDSLSRLSGFNAEQAINVVAIPSFGDYETFAAWHDESDVRVKSSTRANTFAEKINLGFRLTEGRNVLLVGDDVIFHKGWLSAALMHNADVVGISTGDDSDGLATGSPHLLISRDYINEQGSSLDGPGIVCHEGYRHNFVDTEISWLARQRGVYSPAYGSLIEHMHPNSYTAEWDSTYEIGDRSFAEDRELHLRRLAGDR